MHIRCPHCHRAIEVVEDSSFRDIGCPSCGSHFNLVGSDAPTQNGPSEPRSLAHFELLEQLGVGHFGAVWKAKDTALDRFVAIKIPRKEQLDESDIEQFFREARTAAQLRHPNIVDVHEVGRDGDTIFIASDYVEGATLREWLGGRPVPPSEAARLCRKIADALQVAHAAGVIHRDLKPGNIVIDMDDEPHIMDFGLAKRESGEITVTMEGALLGTPAYMPPEQAAGKAHEADPRSDVYSLGVILFEMLTGELPFRGEKRMLLIQIQRDVAPSPRKLNGIVPRDLETICLKCLEKEKSDRYASASDLANDLQRFLHDEPIRAKPVGLVRFAWRWYTGCRESAIWTAGGFAMIMGIVLLLWNLMGVPVVLSVERYRTDRLPALVELASAMITLSVPTILLGYLTLRRYTWALPAGTVFFLGSMLVSWFVYLGLVPLKSTRTEPMDALAGLLLLLSSITTILYVLALYSNRKRWPTAIGRSR